MTTDTVEKRFSSKNPTVDYNASVSLSFSTHFDEDSFIDTNTLIFDCNPIGNNYDRTHLQVKIDDWTSIARIREFLSHHFVDMEDTRRTLTVPIEEGKYSLTPASGEGHKSEDFDEIRIIAEGTRIDFGGPGSMTPYIRTYEIKRDGKPLDTNNADKLLKHLDEIIEEHPEGHPVLGTDNARQQHYSRQRITAQLEAMADYAPSLQENYEKAVREFREEEYADAVRDVGRANEELIDHLTHHLYTEEDLTDNMGQQLQKITNTESGFPKMIGDTVAPAWWLRNQANHPSTYEFSRAEAHFAMLCFQMALEKYVEDVADLDVEY